MDSQNREGLLCLVWVWMKNECRDILRIMIGVMSKHKKKSQERKPK